MRALEVPDLVIIAARVLELDPAEALERVDVDVAAEALHKARCDGPPEEAAARLLRALLHHRPLDERNAEVAVVATLQFLALNGRELVIDRPDALRDLVRGLTAGSLSLRDAVSWFGARLGGRSGQKEMRMRKKIDFGRLWGEQDPCLTPRARRSIELAQQEARELHHNHVGTEHLLLGLARVDQGVAALALDRLNVEADAIRSQIEEIIGRESDPMEETPPYTPRTKKVLDLSLREARRLSHGYIGTEHLLLALIREGEGLAPQILVTLGADLAAVVEEVMRIVRGGHPPVDVLRDGLGNLFDEYERLRDEVVRLRALLRQHGIEPDDGTSRTA
jgi:hypothetical protein